jgi:methylmalonyl-CoA mutase cobalamin-binding domain/chain
MKELTDLLADLKEEVLKVVKEKVEAGEDPIEVLECCRRGIAIVGERFEKGEYFLSELIYASEIFKRIMEIVGPKLKKGAQLKSLGRIIIGTVEGDIHDIGKNIIAALLEAEGFEVVDLGVDVPPEKFIEAIKKYKVKLVGMSALITPAIESMKKTVEAINAAGLRDEVKIIIGGGRVNEYVKEYVGADAWANNASVGVRLCKELIGVKSAE